MEALLRKAEATDADEGKCFGNDSGDGLPKGELEAQAMVAEDQILMAFVEVQDPNDFEQLKPMAELAESNLYETAEEPGKLSATRAITAKTIWST